MSVQTKTPDLQAQIVMLARNLGFDLCRFARAESPEHAAEFRDWLNHGDAGEMDYLARNAHRRCDPQQLLPGARTVIVLAIKHFQGTPAKATTRKIAADMAPPTANGRIARYARGNDYHKVIEERL